MIRDREHAEGSCRDLLLDSGAGPARPISAARQAQMIDAAFTAEPCVEVDGVNQDAPATRALRSGRPALVDFMVRHAAVAAVVLLASGGVAVAGFAIATVLKAPDAPLDPPFSLRSRPPSAVRARRLPSAREIPAITESPSPIEPAWTKSRHQHRTHVAPDLLALANALRAQGKWQEAARAYKQAARAAPQSEPAYVATFAIAALEAEHFGNPERALRLFEDMLLARPQGALAEEVHLGIAQCYRRLGARNSERSALQIFIRQYPKSLSLPRMRARLSELGPP